MCKRFLAALLLVLWPLQAQAQITIPNVLTAGTTITAAALNTNFSTLGSHALDRLAGGNISGNVTLDAGITIDGIDLSLALCSTCAAAFTDVTGAALKNTGDLTTKFYFPSAGTAGVMLTNTQRLLLDGNGLTVYGVNIINASGKIPAISGTYFTSQALDATQLTGAISDARLSANIPQKNTANAFTAANSFATSAIDLLVGQIKFPAVQNASANANTLDDYREGTWTPVIGGDGGQSGQSYASQSGTYVKVGQQVTVTAFVQLTGKGTITGSVVIGNFPFTAANYGGCSVGRWQALATTWVSLNSWIAVSTTTAFIEGTQAAATASVLLTTADISNGTNFIFSCTYQANT